jgi:hypothetical protein
MEEAEIPEPDPLYNGAWYMMEVVIQTRKRDMGELGRMAGRGEVAQTMHTHVSKCKNDKIKGERKKKKKYGFSGAGRLVYMENRTLPT